jgi:hypothetical protein
MDHLIVESITGLVAPVVVVCEVAFSVTLCALIGLKNKVSNLIDDTLSYITVVVEQILE